jgi:preprotein translocase subunit SecA
MRELERQILLRVIDRKWREHLYEMDYLKEGISLRAYAQRNPVVEYQKEGFAMFNTMLEGIKEEAVGFLFHAEVEVREAPQPQPQAPAAPGVPVPVPQAPVEIRARGLGATRPVAGLQYSAPTIDGAAGAGAVTVEREQDRTAAPALGLGGRGPQVGQGPAVGKGPGRRQVGPRPTPGGARRQPVPAAGARRQQAPGQVVGSGPSRNAPCPCGSGKKYKRCHGAPGA